MNQQAQVLVRLEERGERGRVAYVTLANEARANSLNSLLMDEFAQRLDELANDELLRVVVLSGAGERAFCAGANVHELRELTPATGRAFITRVHLMSKRIRDLPVPVIARVNGVCLGAGLEVMAACDMRVAARGALLGMPEVDIGLPSVVEAALFPQLIGWGRTKQLLYTAQNIDADEALSWGLVEKVVEPTQLDAAVEHWVAAIVKADPRAIRLQRELIRHWESMPVNDAIAEGIRNFTRACEGPEPARLVASVIDRLARQKS